MVDPTWPQPGLPVVAYPYQTGDLVAWYRGWFGVVGLAAHDPEIIHETKP